MEKKKISRISEWLKIPAGFIEGADNIHDLHLLLLGALEGRLEIAKLRNNENLCKKLSKLIEEVKSQC